MCGVRSKDWTEGKAARRFDHFSSLIVIQFTFKKTNAQNLTFANNLYSPEPPNKKKRAVQYVIPLQFIAI